MSSGSHELASSGTARCRVHIGRVWHSVELISISFAQITILFSGRLDPETQVKVAVPDFPPKTALVSRCNEGRVDLTFEDPIAWGDLTAWRAAARRKGGAI